MYMPESVRARRRKYRWIKIYKYYLNVMVASFWGGGGGGANARACAMDSSVLCSNDESSHISEGKKLLCN